jgi:hypothetical protein
MTATGTRPSPHSHPNATLTDDGNLRSLTEWIDHEIFSAHGHINIEREEQDELHLLARYRNDTWREMSTYWHFHVTGDKSAASPPAKRGPKPDAQDVRPSNPEHQMKPILTPGGPRPESAAKQTTTITHPDRADMRAHVRLNPRHDQGYRVGRRAM